MRKLVIDNCPACVPIALLIQYMEDLRFTIAEQKCTDFHFHELKIIMISQDVRPDSVNVSGIERIQKHLDGSYYCECHWSIVEVVYNESHTF